jgi:hypothetical protein
MGFLWGDLRERDQLEDGRIILNGSLRSGIGDTN